MTEDIYSKIVELEPKLRKLAFSFEGATGEAADDLFQSIVIHLIERQEKDSTFINQKDSYIIDAGRKSVCLPALKKAGVINRHSVFITPDEDGEIDYYFDGIASPGRNPEDIVIWLETAVTLARALEGGLSDRESEVITLVVQGVKTGEIADKLGINPATVSTFKRRAIDKLHLALL